MLGIRNGRQPQLDNTGRGVPEDYVVAHMWLNLAAATGHEDARRARDRVAAGMTREQIAEAQRRAREWTAAHSAP